MKTHKTEFIDYTPNQKIEQLRLQCDFADNCKNGG